MGSTNAPEKTITLSQCEIRTDIESIRLLINQTCTTTGDLIDAIKQDIPVHPTLLLALLRAVNESLEEAETLVGSIWVNVTAGEDKQ